MKMPSCFGGRTEIEYLGIIDGNGTLRATPHKISAGREWLLPENQKHIKSVVQVCSYYGKFIHPHFSDCDAPVTNMCRENLPGNDVHNEATITAFETLKSRTSYALVLLTP
jgi:hypothetical protein